MSKRISPKIISEIRQLRSQGWTLPELKRQFSSVGYGSIFRHTKDAKIHPKFIKLWQNKRNGSIRKMIKAELNAKSKALKKIDKLSNKEKLLIISALYWAEGTKKDFSLSNSDSNMIKLFINGMVQILKIPKSRMRINIRIFEDMNQERCINHWLQITGFKRSQITSINILEGKKLGKLEFGLCRVRVLKGADMLKYLKAIKEQAILYF